MIPKVLTRFPLLAVISCGTLTHGGLRYVPARHTTVPQRLLPQERPPVRLPACLVPPVHQPINAPPMIRRCCQRRVGVRRSTTVNFAAFQESTAAKSPTALPINSTSTSLTASTC